MKYLGSVLGPVGTLQHTIEEYIKPVAAVLQAPLKLQQKIELLQISVLPICNVLSLQMVTKGYLIQLDAEVCKVV